MKSRTELSDDEIFARRDFVTLVCLLCFAVVGIATAFYLLIR